MFQPLDLDNSWPLPKNFHLEVGRKTTEKCTTVHSTENIKKFRSKLDNLIKPLPPLPPAATWLMEHNRKENRSQMSHCYQRFK